MAEMDQFYSEVQGYLIQVTRELSKFLERILPLLSENWWNKLVVVELSYCQKKRLEQDEITTLMGLDLAGLLRVLDGNWYEISVLEKLSHEERHYLKEMSSVRNRWAHVSIDGILRDDIHRDLDTIQRFVRSIKADGQLVESLQGTKERIQDIYRNQVEEEGEMSGAQLNTPREVSLQNKEQACVSSCEALEGGDDVAEFRVGQIVFTKSDSTRRGPVLSIKASKPENRYDVFIKEKIQTFYASQLQVEETMRRKRSFYLVKNFTLILLHSR